MSIQIQIRRPVLWGALVGLMVSAPVMGAVRVEWFTVPGVLAVLPMQCEPCKLYGDIAGSAECTVDVDDLLCALDGFVDPQLCPQADIAPCGGDGLIDVDDLMAIQDAFVGIYACAHSPRRPEPGPARPWERDINIATFSSVNTRHGNLFTRIPIVAWSGRGPDVSIALYHNSANVDSSLNLTRGMGFNLGPGWTVSYSDQIIFDPPVSPTTALVISEDGAQDVFTKVGDAWVAPAGVFDILSADGAHWRLTHKDQSYHLFDASGLLVKIVDATGSQLVITRTAGRLTDITDASGRRVTFAYDAENEREVITDVPEDSPPHVDPEGLGARHWFLQHDASGHLHSVRDYFLFDVVLAYDATGRILSIRDKEAQAYHFIYDHQGLIKQVTDPAPNDSTCCSEHTTPGCDWPNCAALVCTTPGEECCCGGVYGPECPDPQWDSECVGVAEQVCGTLCGQAWEAPLFQRFTYTCDIGVATHAMYKDRRGSDWGYDYDSSTGNLTAFADPFGMGPEFEYDGQHNLILYRDALDHEWAADYDNCGNMTSLIDPLGHEKTWEFDAINNLRFYTDATGNTIEFEYSDANNPTLLTKVIEPEDGTGNPEAETFLSYYGPSDPAGDAGAWNGLLKRIVDPNGVETWFTYDHWGQVRWTHEGEITPADPQDSGVFAQESVFGTASRVVEGRILGIAHGGQLYYDTGASRRVSGGVCMAALDPAPDKLRALPPKRFPITPCAPDLDGLSADFTIQYNNMDQVTELQFDLIGSGMGAQRTRTMEYDRLGRKKSEVLATTETGLPGIERPITFGYDWALGTYRRIGPDGVETFVQFDTANRVQSVRRGPLGNPVMQVTYTYYDDNRVASVAYLGGASTHYTYDAARRLTAIDHRNAEGTTFLNLLYTYYDSDLVETIRDSTPGGLAAWVLFGYDNRHRLIGELRSGASPYSITYTYDQGGNRTLKSDYGKAIEVRYYYDYEDPTTYRSANNRLMLEETYDTSLGMSTLLATTWYFYNPAGNVTRVVTEEEANPDSFRATRFEYAANGQAVNYVLGETWDADGPDPDPCPENYDIAWAREFRYDNGRARYLNRELDVSVESGLMHDPPEYAAVPDGDTWTDYDGDEPYGDWTVDGSSASEARSFELGLATVEPFAASGATNTNYFHADMIGTTRSLTASGLPTEASVYTAFGERIDGANHRYGYVGAWGYQSHDEIPFLHVGARYYDPSSGRFFQRDPIGLFGGTNVYAYAKSQATRRIDPHGLVDMDAGPSWDRWAQGIMGPYQPPPPGEPYDPSNDLSPAEELERVKKRVRTNTLWCGGGAYVFRPLALIPIIAGLLDELWHFNEPFNPAWGGSYENWTR